MGKNPTTKDAMKGITNKTKITLKDIKKFVSDNFKGDVTIILDDVSPSGARCRWDIIDGKKRYLIRIDRHWWNLVYRLNHLRIKRLILHELGHFKANRVDTSMIEDELSAQLWSIRQARKTGDKALVKECIDHFKTWPSMDWNSGYRRYMLAWKLFKKGKYPRKMYLEV